MCESCDGEGQHESHCETCDEWREHDCIECSGFGYKLIADPEADGGAS